MSLVHISHAQGRQPVTVLHLQERINLGNVAELEAAARAAYDQGTRRLVLDLSATPSITSAGLRAILSIHRLLAGTTSTETNPSRSQFLKLVNPSTEIRRVLQIAGFDLYFEVYDDLASAVTSF